MLTFKQSPHGTGSRAYWWNHSPPHYLIRGARSHRPYVLDPGIYRDPGAWQFGGEVSDGFTCRLTARGTACQTTDPRTKERFRQIQKAINRAAYALNLGEQVPETGVLCPETARVAFRVLVNTPVNTHTQQYLQRPEMTDMDELVFMLAQDPGRAIETFHSVPAVGLSGADETQSHRLRNVGIGIAVSSAIAIATIYLVAKRHRD